MMITRRSFLIGMAAATHALTNPFDQKPSCPVLNGDQTAVIMGYDWGPGIAKTILHLDQEVRAFSVNAGCFAVSETKEAFNWATFSRGNATAERVVVDAYTCEADGRRSYIPSDMVAIEMACDPNSGSPYIYDLFSGMNSKCNPYELKVTLTEESTLAAKDGTLITELNIDPVVDLDATVMPELKYVDLTGCYTGKDGKTLTYGSFKPMNANNGKKHPLVIWLHGAGEGGTDPSINNYGNKVAPLYGNKFQKVMGGAFVLTPQTPMFWLCYNENGDWNNNPGTDSIYLPTLMELIQNYVAENPEIDPNRIYVGGCSNGGYMTMDLVLNYPKYFAAAFPICEAYADAGITDEQIMGVKDTPLWFIYAENDTTVPPAVYEAPTIARLKAVNANLHTSIFADVHDTSGLYKGEDGQPYQYMGHWSWIYFFNDECVSDQTGENMWKWMAAQHN